MTGADIGIFPAPEYRGRRRRPVACETCLDEGVIEMEDGTIERCPERCEATEAIRE